MIVFCIGTYDFSSEYLPVNDGFAKVFLDIHQLGTKADFLKIIYILRSR